jgi:hypothetical protein
MQVCEQVSAASEWDPVSEDSESSVTMKARNVLTSRVICGAKILIHIVSLTDFNELSKSNYRNLYPDTGQYFATKRDTILLIPLGWGSVTCTLIECSEANQRLKLYFFSISESCDVVAIPWFLGRQWVQIWTRTVILTSELMLFLRPLKKIPFQWCHVRFDTQLELSNRKPHISRWILCFWTERPESRICMSTAHDESHCHYIARRTCRRSAFHARSIHPSSP